VRAVDGVTEIVVEDGDAYRVKTTRDVREELARAVVAVGQLRELRPAALGLERLFQQLTTKVQS